MFKAAIRFFLITSALVLFCGSSPKALAQSPAKAATAGSSSPGTVVNNTDTKLAKKPPVDVDNSRMEDLDDQIMDMLDNDDVVGGCDPEPIKGIRAAGNFVPVTDNVQNVLLPYPPA